MAIIRIGRQEVDLNISQELEVFEWGYNARWTSDKLVAASPFRTDSTPSFFVNLETGGWADSGAIDDEYVKGGFVKLLSYLRSESEEETTEYLLGEYGALYEITPNEPIRLPEIRLFVRPKRIELAPETITPAISPYLSKRAISPEIQRLYGVGYNKMHKGFTAIPWNTPEGVLANIKYRSTSDKRFFYKKDATPIRSLVYGLDIVNKTQEETAVLCEGEIDAMSWATAGIPAIACGGSSISQKQIDAIKRSSIRRLLVGGDNDPAGQRLNAEVVQKLAGYVELYVVNYGDCNDGNEYLKTHGINGLKQLENITVSKLPVNCLQLFETTLKW